MGDQVRQMEDHKLQAEQDQQEVEQDLREWYQKCIEAERENVLLQRQNQELQQDLRELGSQLRQERDVNSFCNPGEFLNLMKTHEGESLVTENSRLKRLLAKTRVDLDLCVRKLDEQDNIIRGF